ncbi:Pumilio-family_RNA-binding protein [Hexamita inflata]|uniref:Putative n=1 Tax=Hexamita inflata TaxID=28002 RepID=A0AA86QQL3_9EUKA|nr:Pumilio-family RNA-binding protein [Hexamita inflata]CAI9958667.1 Pumilio-family RNA-binding protein [Hexamita inflata]
MSNSPLHLRLARQILGDDYVETGNPSPKNSPFIDYQPYRQMRRSKVLPDDQSIDLKTSSLGPLSSSQIKHSVTEPDVYCDFFEEVKIQPQQQPNGLYITQMCCQPNPVMSLQKYQQQANLSDTQIIQTILDQNPEQLQQLAINPQGNFSFQKLYQSLTVQTRIKCIQLLDFIELAFSQHGTRSVQKIILLAVEPETQAEIQHKLQNKVVDLILNPHGNHCVQKVLDTFPPAQFQFVVEECAKDLIKVSCHQHGCCVLQRCLDKANDDQFVYIVELVKKAAQGLVVDQFGNYVFQYLLDSTRMTPEQTDLLIETILGKEVEFTRMKSSSHVVEKCLSKGGPVVIQKIVKNLVRNEDVLVELCCDRYANYVIQKVLTVCDDDIFEVVAEMIENNMDIVQTSLFSKHIVQIVRGEV